MIAATLNKRIIIEKEVKDNTPGDTPKPVWQFMKNSWANIRLLSGATQYTEDGALPFSTTEIIVRYDEKINYNTRIKYDNQYYKINHIHVVNRKDWMRLMCIVWEEN